MPPLHRSATHRHATLVPEEDPPSPRSHLHWEQAPAAQLQETELPQEPPPGPDYPPRLRYGDDPELRRVTAAARIATARTAYEALCASEGISHDYIPRAQPTSTEEAPAKSGINAFASFLSRWVVFQHHPGLKARERSHILSDREERSMYQLAFWAYNNAMECGRFSLALYIAVRYLRYTPEEGDKRRRNFDPIREREENAVLALYDQQIANGQTFVARFLCEEHPVIEWHLAAKNGSWEDAYRAMPKARLSTRRRIETLRGYHAFLLQSGRTQEAAALASRHDVLKT